MKDLIVLIVGSKTFQERCERIRNILHRNGIEGEPTLAKCKRLKKQLKLKEEVAGVDPNVIIESKEDQDRSKRSARRATQRNYVYDELDEMKRQPQPEYQADASKTLQKMEELIESDSEYNGEDHNRNNNNSFEPSNLVEAIIVSNDVNTVASAQYTNNDLNPDQGADDVPPSNAQNITTT